MPVAAVRFGWLPNHFGMPLIRPSVSEASPTVTATKMIHHVADDLAARVVDGFGFGLFFDCMGSGSCSRGESETRSHYGFAGCGLGMLAWQSSNCLRISGDMGIAPSGPVFVKISPKQSRWAGISVVTSIGGSRDAPTDAPKTGALTDTVPARAPRLGGATEGAISAEGAHVVAPEAGGPGGGGGGGGGAK